MVVRVYFLDKYVDVIIDEDDGLTKCAECLYEAKVDDYYMILKKLDGNEIVIRAKDIVCMEQI